jgi:hypothetical protein
MSVGRQVQYKSLDVSLWVTVSSERRRNYERKVGDGIYMLPRAGVFGLLETNPQLFSGMLLYL